MKDQSQGRKWSFSLTWGKTHNQEKRYPLLQSLHSTRFNSTGCTLDEEKCWIRLRSAALDPKGWFNRLHTGQLSTSLVKETKYLLVTTIYVGKWVRSRLTIPGWIGDSRTRTQGRKVHDPSDQLVDFGVGSSRGLRGPQWSRSEWRKYSTGQVPLLKRSSESTDHGFIPGFESKDGNWVSNQRFPVVKYGTNSL